MNFPKIRLIIAAVLFALWVSYLGYIAATSTDPGAYDKILSRPQFLVSSAYIVGEVTSEEGRPAPSVKVKTVFWDPSGTLKEEESVLVQFHHEMSASQGWFDEGEYILPLTRLQDGSYRITPLPPSPGYVPHDIQSPARYRIYPATDNTLRQLKEIVEKRKASNPF